MVEVIEKRCSTSTTQIFGFPLCAFASLRLCVEFRSWHRSARRRPKDADCGGLILIELRGRANRTPDEFAAAIGTNETELLRCTFQTKSALEGADVSLAGIRRQIPVAAFAVWTQFQRHVDLTPSSYRPKFADCEIPQRQSNSSFFSSNSSCVRMRFSRSSCSSFSSS